MKILEKYNVPIAVFIVTDAVVNGNFWWEYIRKREHKRLTGLKNTEHYKRLPEKVFREKIQILKNNISLTRSCITIEELRALSSHRLITIGSHSVTHPILPMCNRESQYHEITDSKRMLEEWTGKEIQYFAFPNGDYDEDIIEIARESGYKLCFTIESTRINVKKVNRFSIPRIALYEKGGYYENIAKILGIWQKICKMLKTL